MDKLEEMLRCRDAYERYGIQILKANLDDNIDKIITEGIQDRK